MSNYLKSTKMKVKIAGLSDLQDLFSAAIKTTYHTRSPGGIDRCVDVLSKLKSLSLSVNDIRQLCKSIFKLESLRRHRSPKIRKESQSLFDSWLRSLYAQGRNQPFKSSRTQFRLKPKKLVLARCSKEEQRSLTTLEPEEIKKKTGFLELKKREDERSQTREAVGIKKEETTGFLELKKKQDQRSLIHRTEKIKKETNTNLLEPKKKNDSKTLTREVVVKIKKEAKTDACKSVTTKQPCGVVKDAGYQKMRSVTSTALQQHPKRNIKDNDGKVTTKTLIPPPRRVAACKYVPAKDSGNPKSLALKAKTEEALELFEAAKKAADVANAKGILLGKVEASRCVEAISLLMEINVTPKPKEPRRMFEKLEGLVKHKDRKICNAASALLQLWRQRIREQERKESSTKTFSNNKPRKAHQICGQGFTRESTKTSKLVM